MNKARRPLIAGNWKMYRGGADGVDLAAGCAKLASSVPGVDLLIAPPFTVLAAASHETDGSNVAIAAQNLYPKKEGAFTGEISATMLKDAGCTWVLCGHSERRQLFGDTNERVAEKVAAAFDNDLAPIVCVGETLDEREAGQTLSVVRAQIDAVLPRLARECAGPNGKAAAIAYEPVWAIGTGKNAGPAEAQEVHGAIRGWLEAASAGLGEKLRILYGGSVKPENAKGLLTCPDIDGALIGNASLDIGSFGAIARTASEISQSSN